MITKPTPKEVGARLEIIPERLSAAAFSMKTSDLISDIAATNKLDQATASLLSEVVAWVLMGFVHYSGAPEAIQEHAKIAPDLARAISAELNERLFKAYNADLDKIYTPMGLPPAQIVGGAAPMPLKISNATPVPLAPAPIKPLSAAMSAAAPRPMPMSPMPVPASVSAPAPKMPAPQAVPPAKPAPFMLHQESSAAPLVTGATFKLDIPKDMFRSAPTRPVAIPRPPKAAELEIGKVPLPPKPPGGASFRTIPAAQSRVVHYTDLKTAVVPGIGAPQPPMNPAPAAKPAPLAPAAPLNAAKWPVAPPPPASTPPPGATAMPKPPAPIVPPLPPKPPKVVNFGPEEVK